jgi:hypothetical protein
MMIPSFKGSAMIFLPAPESIASALPGLEPATADTEIQFALIVAQDANAR